MSTFLSCDIAEQNRTVESSESFLLEHTQLDILEHKREEKVQWRLLFALLKYLVVEPEFVE